MIKDKFIILSGAPGSGKSTILKQLRARGFSCIDEPARQIIAEQRLIRGAGVSDENPELFIDLMLSRAIGKYQDTESKDRAIFFDRGVPDYIAYAFLYDLEFGRGWKAASEYRYNPTVFFTPNWEDIYVTDEERTMSFEASAKMGDRLREIYVKNQYNVVDIPCGLPEERVAFILSSLPKNLLG